MFWDPSSFLFEQFQCLDLNNQHQNMFQDFKLFKIDINRTYFLGKLDLLIEQIVHFRNI